MRIPHTRNLFGQAHPPPRDHPGPESARAGSGGLYPRFDTDPERFHNCGNVCNLRVTFCNLRVTRSDQRRYQSDEVQQQIEEIDNGLAEVNLVP
jgi:hypothetical protein